MKNTSQKRNPLKGTKYPLILSFFDSLPNSLTSTEHIQFCYPQTQTIIMSNKKQRGRQRKAAKIAAAAEKQAREVAAIQARYEAEMRSIASQKEEALMAVEHQWNWKRWKRNGKKNALL